MSKYSTIWERVNIRKIVELSSADKEDLAIAEMYCPKCKRYTTNVYLQWYNNPLYLMNYCPHCGERMVAKEDV